MANLDEFTEKTSVGLGSNLANSFGKIVAGILMVLISFPLLWFNEGCSVKTHKALQEGASSVISIAADKIIPANEGKLVHIMGKAESSDSLKDADFGLTVQGIALSRNVEMYQWVETSETKEEKKTGGGTEKITTYKYAKEWKTDIVSSSKFKKPEGHSNPDAMPYSSASYDAAKVSLGAFALNADQISRLNSGTEVSLKDYKVPENLQEVAKVQGNNLYLGDDPSAPAVGDVRVHFSQALSGQSISLIAKQVGNSFAPYASSNGANIDLLNAGSVPAAQMFAEAESASATMTWVLRVVGFLLMAFGFASLFSPFVALANILPFLGGVVEFGSLVVGFVFSAIFSTLTIALAWIFYRPLVGVSLLVVTVGLLVFAFTRKKKLA